MSQQTKQAIAEAAAGEPRMLPVDRIRVVPGRNARAEVGDVSELAVSIQANGILQALTVAEGEGQDGVPTYDLIAGERRLQAARQLGLQEVPCLVRRGLDARQLVAAMLVENLQREDLTPLEEAAGIQRLVELEMSQHEIARQLGCSQSHVSKRLALLQLPDKIRAAIGRPSDSGGITVGEALELVKLADHPQHLEEAFKQGRQGYYGTIAGTVRTHLDQLERERKRAAARSRLMAAGVKILKEHDHYDGWTGSRERPLRGQGVDYAAIALTVADHEGEDCHGAVIDRDGEVIYVCRDPFRHADADPKSAKQIVEARQEEEALREENRLRREAARGRREAIERVLAGANSSHLPMAARQILECERVNESKVACGLLGLEVPPKTGYGSPDWSGTLSEYAGTSMAAAIRALVAMAAAHGEEVVSNRWMAGRPVGKRHLELLMSVGYSPNESDRKHLEERPMVTDQEDESLICRGCGCTDEEPCHGGCHWVEDPEGLGELCSRCLDEMRASGELDETPEEGAEG